MAMAVGLSVPAGSRPVGWGSAWGCERWGQHGKWMTVGAEPFPRAPSGPALASLAFSRPLTQDCGLPSPLMLLPICTSTSSRLKMRLDHGLIQGRGGGRDPQKTRVLNFYSPL